MNARSTKKQSPQLNPADRAFLRRPDDRGIDYSDIPPLSAEVLHQAKLIVAPRKVRITTHLDADVLAWLRQGGPRYQTRINAILRAVMSGSVGTSRSTKRRMS